MSPPILSAETEREGGISKGTGREKEDGQRERTVNEREGTMNGVRKERARAGGGGRQTNRQPEIVKE